MLCMCLYLCVYISDVLLVLTSLYDTSRGNKQNVYSTIERVGESLDTS